MSLHNGQVGLTQSEKCYSMDESDKTWFVFQSDSEEEEFMVLIEFANSWCSSNLMQVPVTESNKSM